MVRELTTADGAFAASQDADTDGVEGLTFTWTAAEIREVLGDDAPPFLAAYGVTDVGNWEGLTILSRVWPDARRRPVRADAASRRAWRRSRATLLERRAGRPQPARDDKALAAWNGLAIAAFADAGRLLGDDGIHRPRPSAQPRRSSAASSPPMASLGRSWKDGRAIGQGVLEDYADLADGLLALYEATFDERWFTTARALMDRVLDAVRRSGGRLLRHRRRPRAARRAAEGRAGQRRPVRAMRWRRSSCCGWRPGPARAAIATPPSARCARSRRSWRAIRPGSPSGCRRWTSRWPPSSRWRSSATRRIRRPGRSSPRRPRLPAEPGRGRQRGSGRVRRPAAGRPGRHRRQAHRLCLPRLRLPPPGDDAGGAAGRARCGPSDQSPLADPAAATGARDDDDRAAACRRQGSWLAAAT